MQTLRHLPGEGRIRRRQRNRRGQAARHFDGKTGPGKHAAGGFAHHFRHDLMRQQPAAGFQPLAHPEEGKLRGALAQLFQQAAKSGQRRSENRQVCRCQGGGKIGLYPQRRGKGKAGQEAPVFACLRHLAGAILRA